VFQGFLGGEDPVAPDVRTHLLPAAPGVPGRHLLRAAPRTQQLLGPQSEIAALPLQGLGERRPAERDPGARQREPLAALKRPEGATGPAEAARGRSRPR
jgi:hypothetical protein